MAHVLKLSSQSHSIATSLSLPRFSTSFGSTSYCDDVFKVRSVLGLLFNVTTSIKSLGQGIPGKGLPSGHAQVLVSPHGQTSLDVSFDDTQACKPSSCGGDSVCHDACKDFVKSSAIGGTGYHGLTGTTHLMVSSLLNPLLLLEPRLQRSAWPPVLEHENSTNSWD